MVYKTPLAQLVPDRCPGCNAATASGFCSGCRDDFVRIDDPCPACGLDRPVARCPRDRACWSVDRVIAPFDYVEPLQGHLKRLKFAGARRLGRALGELLAVALVPRSEPHAVDAIVAVPMHRHRLLERGYNQARELARPIATAVGVPLLHAGIARRRPTIAQSRLAARLRFANLRDAFVVTRNVHDRKLAIVDDVLTTGATVNALAAALKRAGAIRVDAWTLARAL